MALLVAAKVTRGKARAYELKTTWPSHAEGELYLSNITEVTAKWSLNYVKFPKKITVSKYTTTKWEEENHKKTDDPDVFEFSISTVSNQPFTFLGLSQGQDAAIKKGSGRPLCATRTERRGREAVAAPDNFG